MVKRRIKYEVGQQLGDCTYISDVPDINGYRYALFKCQCSNNFTAAIHNIKSRQVKVCSIKCEYYKTNTRTHGKSSTSIYKAWLNLKTRCNDPKHKHYSHYGGRGIKVCDRWLNSFENFLEDVGEKPTPQHTLDRIDNNGNYEPSNCRWATRIEQANNNTRNINITYNGQTKTLQQWADVVGIDYKNIWARLKAGWDAHKAFFTPVGAVRISSIYKQVVDKTTGIFYDSINEAAKAYNIKTRTLHAWLTGVYPNKSSLELV